MSVCFQGWNRGQYHLYRAHATGGEPAVLPTPEGEPGNPSWTPDGKTVYYQLDQFGRRNIWALNLETGQSQQITRGDADDAHPEVSPDGRSILFLRNHSELYVLPLAGGHPKLVRAVKGYHRLIEFPAWTPQGRGIVFSLAEKDGDVFVLRAGEKQP